MQSCEIHVHFFLIFVGLAEGRLKPYFNVRVDVIDIQ